MKGRRNRSEKMAPELPGSQLATLGFIRDTSVTHLQAPGAVAAFPQVSGPRVALWRLKWEKDPKPAVRSRGILNRAAALRTHWQHARRDGAGNCTRRSLWVLPVTFWWGFPAAFTPLRTTGHLPSFPCCSLSQHPLLF